MDTRLRGYDGEGAWYFLCLLLAGVHLTLLLFVIPEVRYELSGIHFLMGQV